MRVNDSEIIKTHPSEFGGLSLEILSSKQISARYCGAADCAQSALIQTAVPGGYIPICGVHSVLLHLLSMAVLGDPLPAQGAKEYAKLIGVDWDWITSLEPKYPTTPERFACMLCGAGMQKNPAGSYVHNCEG